VPKASGGTVALLFQQNNFQVINFDMTTSEFFETLSDERRLLDAYRTPAPRRHSHLLSGHFRLDHPILRRIGVRHFIVPTTTTAFVCRAIYGTRRWYPAACHSSSMPRRSMRP
jgi:hypothetical protein